MLCDLHLNLNKIVKRKNILAKNNDGLDQRASKESDENGRIMDILYR